MRKSLWGIVLAVTMLFLCSEPGVGAEPDVKTTVGNFIKVVSSRDRAALAGYVAYPLQRETPLPSIDTPAQLLERFDEVFDEKVLREIENSDVARDWAEMGWRGIMFRDGVIWLDSNGKISAVNYQTEKEKSRRANLIASDKQSLYAGLRHYLEPVLEWKTKGYRIRIDQTGETRYRYAVWPVNKTSSDKPDLVLDNGELVFDGSGGNHYFDFKNGSVLYRCRVNVIGADDTPPGILEVYKNGKIVLSQAATEAHKDRK